MKENFDKAFEFVMRWEGYKSDDPDDSGGRTIWGISERAHPEVVERLWNLPKEESREEAKVFYKAEYWDKIHAFELFDKFDIFLFDTAVNMGKNFAIGLALLDDTLFDIIIARLKRYSEIAQNGNNIKYLRGWLNRVIDLYEFIGR